MGARGEDDPGCSLAWRRGRSARGVYTQNAFPLKQGATARGGERREEIKKEKKKDSKGGREGARERGLEKRKDAILSTDTPGRSQALQPIQGALATDPNRRHTGAPEDAAEACRERQNKQFIASPRIKATDYFIKRPIPCILSMRMTVSKSFRAPRLSRWAR